MTTHCKDKCQLGYIISNYVTPLMQCLTNDLKEFNMRLLTTKCLNTAVMVLFFFLGSKAPKRAETCDSAKVRTEYLEGKIHTRSRLREMMMQILRYTKHRYVFYILINDGDLTRGTETVYFPGHVFVVEKFPIDDKRMGYNVFQSYINQYDLKDYLQKSNKSFAFSQEDMKQLMLNLQSLFSKDAWDHECVRIWQKFTKVDSSEFLGCKHTDVLSICFTRDRLSHCLEKIQKYATSKLKTIEDMPKEQVYGPEHMYHSSQRPLTIKQMQDSLKGVLMDIEKVKNNVS